MAFVILIIHQTQPINHNQHFIIIPQQKANGGGSRTNNILAIVWRKENPEDKATSLQLSVVAAATREVVEEAEGFVEGEMAFEQMLLLEEVEEDVVEEMVVEEGRRGGGRSRGARGRGRGGNRNHKNTYHGRGGGRGGRHHHPSGESHSGGGNPNENSSTAAAAAETTTTAAKPEDKQTDHLSKKNNDNENTTATITNNNPSNNATTENHSEARTGRGRGRGGRGGRSRGGGGGRDHGERDAGNRGGRSGRGGRGRSRGRGRGRSNNRYHNNNHHGHENASMADSTAAASEEHAQEETITTDDIPTSTNNNAEEQQQQDNTTGTDHEKEKETSSTPHTDDTGKETEKPMSNGTHESPPPAQNNDEATAPTGNDDQDTTKDNDNDSVNNETASAPTLSLPKPPQVANGRSGGGPMVLMRSPKNQGNNNNNNNSEVAEETDHQSNDVLVATNNNNKSNASGTGEKPAKEKKKKNRNKPRKDKKKKQERKNAEEGGDEEDDDDADAGSTNQGEAVPAPSTTQALKALPAQEVSITASTKVQLIRRNENSSASLSKLGEVDNANDGTTNTNSKKSAKSKKSKGKKSDSNKAARRFNNDVRMCVEQSDPDAMRSLLRNKKNHKYPLEPMVLEIVMKAYLMAAMFDDALYCLRNCVVPGTLSTLHTERILQCLPQNLRNSSAYTAADMINALCIATEFDTPTSRTYLLRVVRGISLEFLEEATSARDRICSAPCERLVRSGVCVVDARLKRGKKPTELVVMPGEQLGVFVPDSMENRGIQAGDAVSILPYAGPYPMSAESLDRNMIEATVVNTNPMVIRLQDKTNAQLHSMLTEPVDGNVYRIDKLANRMGFNRQLAAAVAVASPIDPDIARDPRRPCPQLIQAITAMDENIDRAMKQSGGFQPGQLTSTAALCSEAVPWSFNDENEENLTQDEIRQTSSLALEKYKALERLNLSQRMAVEGATTNRLTLIQGPPGTGKTAVAIRILQHWARLGKSAQGEAHSPILATSDSNIAVDNLVEGCASVGLSVVRLGRPEAIRPELLRYCIDRPPSSYNNNGQSYTSNSAFKERLKTLKNAQVICCTCIGSGGDILDAMTFDRVLVDEATQATEPAVLVPLMRGCRQLVLVGDHCQLPPTVLSTRAEEEGHGVPLFSRMVACGVPPFMLDTQYRMHPCIAMFPSDLFYGGKLRNGVTSPERRPLAGFPWPREEFPVAYIPVKGIEMDDGVSKYNELEADAACRAVQALLDGGQCTVSDIAVCTPYAAQARLIRRLTRRLMDSTGPPYIEVSSVDGFQGREKEAVVFSAVRSNDYGAIGFTSDWRRVNVSFTRARRALIVIGNDVTLRRGDPDTWSPWLAWADAHGINMDKPGIPRGRYDPEQLRRVRGGTTAAEMLRDVLERQQAQLKSAEQQLEKAEKSSLARDTFNQGMDDAGGGTRVTLEEEVALLENADGNWDDDSDDEDLGELRHSVSQPTLTSGASSNDLKTDDDSGDSGPQDAWDL
ncbi:polymerase alpha-associated DNA helicase A [Seminavis robusta]|uniref:Polymerase alpha-associated DNA helicase A n=1 Tax=Seminavis robusta TaxID=568900 RepID=A0A9N8HMB4_9STRA|nr:polymerase alpha-associated DNA helicase A [Seminavis robusta]|eukprot:Sro985_g227980.1 polymerase alpha-associated DNA helicase A (1493) ;mRNA; r:5362-10180